jgi:predicted ribosome quality control (RQC) complex YloA/Tae2 family protein
VAPRALPQCDDADLVRRDAVRLLPFAPPGGEGETVHPPTWTAAGAACLSARVRGQRFAREQRRRLDDARHRAQRLAQLRSRLGEDRAGLPAADALRRSAEALLAHGGEATPGAAHVDVPDPWDGERRLRIAIDGRVSLPVNANRLFDKARRIDRARRHVDQRLEQVERDLESARADERAALDARNAADLRPLPAAPFRPGAPARRAASGPRRYLTSRGLEVVAGRGARENQKITFEVAAPDDWWLHARDVPGAHVVLRDPEGRAGDEDLREAAEVAAFFSDAGAEAQADVHATRRKHLRPGGGAGRVRVLHSQTLRVAPRDPEGRLRKR